MKNHHPMEVTCAVCGSSSLQDVLLVSNSNTGINPGVYSVPLARNTLMYQIQECPSCRYCAPDLTCADVAVKDIVSSGNYLQIANDNEISALIRRYLQYSYCAEMLEDNKTAFFGYLTASWICDDTNEMRLGRQCRDKAIEYMIKCKKRGDLIWNHPGFFELMLADLYRRTAEFEKGSKMIQFGLSKVVEPILKSSLEFTKSRIDRWDTLP